MSRLVLALKNLNLEPAGAARACYLLQCGLGRRNGGWIDEHGHTSGAWHQLVQEFQPFWYHLLGKEINTCRVAARPGDAGDKSKPDRVLRYGEDDRNSRSCCLRCKRRSSVGCGDHGDAPAHQIGRKLRQPLELTLCEAVLDRHVLAFDKADLPEPLAKSSHSIRGRIGRSRIE